MGTRSLTTIYDGKDAIVTMYLQFDGYISGHGKALAEWLYPFVMVNGFSGNPQLGDVANGAGCLAAQMISRFKTRVGGCYLCKPETSDVCEEYTYLIYVNGTEITLEVLEGDMVIFIGSVTDFYDFASN